MSSFLHSDGWERFLEAANFPVNRYADQLFSQRKFAFGNYWYSSRCTLGKDLGLASGFAKDSVFLRLEPVDSQSYHNLVAIAADFHLSLLPTYAVNPRQTCIVNLEKELDQVIENMKPKHRYNTRLSLRANLEVEVYSQNLESHFERFWDLLSTTSSRQGFRTHPKDYYLTMAKSLEAERMAHFIFIRFEEKDLATMLLITHEDTATYLHGASSLEYKEKMAPYLLHYEAIKQAQSTGCHFYDLWGTDAELNPHTHSYEGRANHPSYGTTRFKLGFNGEVVEYPGCYDLILKPTIYTIYKGLRNIRGSKRSFS